MVTTPLAQRKDPSSRRREILAAAGDIALSHGLDAVTNRRIAADLRCAPGLVHHYFPVAADLVAEALRDVLMQEQLAIFAEVGAFDDTTTTLAALLDTWVTPEATNFGLLWLDAWSLARQHKGIQEVVDFVMKRGHVEVVAILNRGIGQGHFVCADPDAVAWYLLTTLDGLIVHSSLRVNESPVDMKVAILRFTEHQLGLDPGALATKANKLPAHFE